MKPPLTRRRFIGTIATAISFPALAWAGASTRRLPIAFSTLGCPRWDWNTILGNAAKWEFAAIELRGLQAEMDLTKCAEFSPSRLAATRKDLAALHLRISDLGASAHMHEVDPAKRTRELDEARRFIDLAHRLEVPYVRVFGDRLPPGEPKEQGVDRIVSGLVELGRHARGSGVTVLLESHGDLTDSPTLLRVMQGANLREVALLWDAHHTVVAGKENPRQTFAALGRYVRHTHLKDSQPAGADRRYVLTGQGSVPVRETVQVLVQNGYRGYYCLEWEKRWHPEIEEPEVAFPQYAKVMAEYLQSAGYRAD